MKTLSTILGTLLAASALYSARADITTGLVGYWTLDAGSGSTAADATANNNTGTLTQFADTGFTSMWTPNGWFNSAVVFNQNGENTNCILVPDSGSMNAPSVSKAWTLAAWVKGSVAGASQTANAGIICKGLQGAEAYSLYINGSGKFTGNQRNAGNTGGQSLSSTFAPAANAWYHVAVTFTTAGGTSKIQMVMYINGTNNANGAQNTYTTVYSTNLPVVIGNRASSSGAYTLPFQGLIDDVRIYNRAMPASDIFQLYTNGAPGSAHLPVIATAPRDVTCYSNDTAVFSVGVATTNSYVPVSYQWLFNGAPIAGATASSYTLANVTSANAGSYSVTVTNLAGSVTSSSGQLTVRALPAADTTSGLVGWWKMDDASGSSSAADSSGQGNSATLNNFTDTSYTTEWVDGILGGALSFNNDGAGSNVVALPSLGSAAPAVLDFSASPVFSLSAWVQASLVQSNEAAIIAKGTGNGGEQYVLELSGGKFRFFARDTNRVSFNITSSTTANGVWQHVAAVLNATNGIMTLYVNGAVAGSSVAPFSLQTTNHEVSIGNRQSGSAGYNDPFTGAIDDVRIYSRDLTAADVYGLYAQAAYPIITAEMPAYATNAATLFAGASPTYKVSVTGAAPLVYQWYTNGVPDASGTNASYQFQNLAVGASSVYCVITNDLGSATSDTWNATVVAQPTAAYPQAVLHDGPTGYWRLNETPDDGAGNLGRVANDYWGSHFGFYQNTVLGQDGYSRGLSNQFSYYPATEPDETSVQFGSFNGGISNLVNSIQGVDFSTPTNHTGNFSLEAWVKGDSSQLYNAGIVAKGAWGAEQFTLDTGGTSRAYRFTMRDAGKAPYYVTSNTNLPDGLWHHLVGVLDQAHSNACFYIDGVKVASLACSPSNGVFSTAVPMSIGCRLGTSGNYDQQFYGEINDVATYNYALSAAQVASHYLAAGIPPAITLNPVNFTNVDEGTTLIVAAAGGGGTPPVTTQWYDVTSGTPGVPVVNQTNTTLVISNISAAQFNGHSLALSLGNVYGHPYSSSVYINVASGAPSVSVSPASVTVYSNQPVVFHASAQGTEPFTYQWSVNGTAVPGATTSSYTARASVGAANLTCMVTGPGGNGSGSATLTGLAYPSDSYARGILADQPSAYWRLDEPLFAGQANDYVGGHTANYNSVTNGLPGCSPSNPDTAAGFGMNGNTSYSLALEQDNSGSGLPNIDFSKLGSNAQFSVEAWVKAPVGQIAGAAIVTKGYGSGGEQFNLDLSGSAFRFFVRDSAAGVHGPTSTFKVDGTWHYVVGVCDMSNGVVNLYVDGALQASTTNTPGLGILGPLPASSPVLTSIGARMSSSTDSGYSMQLTNATVDEVALYAYALSSNQVAAHYSAAGLRPQFVQDLQAQMYAYVGCPLTLSVLASSATPLGYQWKRNGVNLVDGGGISGSQSSTLTDGIAQYSDSGSTFQVMVTNANGSVSSTLATLTVLSQLGFNGFGNEWASQGSALTAPSYISANTLRLIDGGKSEASSSFFKTPVYVGSFLATYTYQDVGGAGADGMAFVVQNDARGAAALGVNGSSLGYGGITNSAAVEFNIYANNGIGYAVRTNGVAGKPYESISPVNTSSGDPIGVSILYLNGVLTLTLTDAVAQASFTASTNIDIPSAVGSDLAYVGFTAGDGSAVSTQVVSNFTFVSIPALSIQATPDSHIVLSWPTVSGGQQLQQSAGLAPLSWSNVSTPPTTAGGFNQVTLPLSGTSSFYRLINAP